MHGCNPVHKIALNNAQSREVVCLTCVGFGHCLCAAAGLIDDIARLLRPIQQLVVAVYDNQHLPTQSQASSANQRLRHQVFAAYSANSDSGQESWCVVTGLWWPSLARAGCPYVRAAHIMGRATPAIDWVSSSLY